MIAEQTKESPNAMSCPPLVFVGALGVGFILNWLMPMYSYSSQLSQLFGGILGLAGSSLATWGVWRLLRAGTGVRPDRPVTALVTDGPYRFTRNPLYIALTIIYAGITIAWGAWWPLATLVPALAVVHWRIVRREEDFLEARFGDTYRAYKAQVRRWV